MESVINKSVSSVCVQYNIQYNIGENCGVCNKQVSE